MALISQKGGTGKTTSAHNIGAGLSRRGCRVLIVDLDAQGSLTSISGASSEGLTSLELLRHKCTLKEAVQKVSGIDVIAASEGLSVEGILTGTGREYRLREALRGLRGAYNYVILDCPPNLGILSINALTAANSCIITTQADTLSLQAVKQIAETIEVIRKYTNKALSIKGLLITRYNGRAVLNREAAELLEVQAGTMGTKVFQTRIRDTVVIREAQAMRQDVFTYAPRANGTKDYEALITEIMEG